MNVLHILASGHAGGIEILCKDYALFSENNNIFLFLWESGRIADEMEYNGNNVIRLNASKKDFFGPLSSIKKICINEKIDCIIEHHSAPLAIIYLLMIKREIPNIKTVMYAHCSVEDMIRKHDRKRFLFYNSVIRYALNRVNAIVAISNYVKKSLINEFGILDDRIIVVYNGVNISKFVKGEQKNSTIPTLIYVGRLVADKGVQNILRSLALLSNNIDYQFYIVGDGVFRSELEIMTKKLQLEKKVKFLGTRRDVSQLMQSSDVFIHIPNWEEGFGITVVEAMATGLICVCGKSGGIPEIINDGKNGILVDRGNDKELAKKLEELILNLNSREVKQMRVLAHNRANDFTVTSFAKRLDRVVLELLRN